jgi:hypothetical protein
VWRPDDPHGLVLHVPRLRHEHRLQLAVQRLSIFISLQRKGPDARMCQSHPSMLLSSA